MFDVGRWCVKIAGRDGGKKCVIVEKIDDTFVLVDGETRRKRCNVLHLEPLTSIASIKEGASHEEIVELFKSEGITLAEKRVKEKPVKEELKETKKAEPKKPRKKAKKE